jgi:hypothetical protein
MCVFSEGQFHFFSTLSISWVLWSVFRIDDKINPTIEPSECSPRMVAARALQACPICPTFHGVSRCIILSFLGDTFDCELGTTRRIGGSSCHSGHLLFWYSRSGFCHLHLLRPHMRRADTGLSDSIVQVSSLTVTPSNRMHDRAKNDQWLISSSQKHSNTHLSWNCESDSSLSLFCVPDYNQVWDRCICVLLGYQGSFNCHRRSISQMYLMHKIDISIVTEDPRKPVIVFNGLQPRGGQL